MPLNLFTKRIYLIDCKNCDKFFIGETSCSLKKGSKNIKRDFLNNNLNNVIFAHSVDNNHSFHFNDAKIISNYRF